MSTKLAARRPSADLWSATIGWSLLCVLPLLVLTGREWGQMAWQWWNADSYSHILLVPPIIAWLIWSRVEALAKEQPSGWWPAIGGVAVALTLWGVGRTLDINLFAQAGAVGALIATLIALLGLRIALLLALPLGFMGFLVPFGDEIIAPLQTLTAAISIALLDLVNIPARLDGIYIHTPAGLFIVAEACAGVRFLIAMIAIGVLTAFTGFSSWNRRALLLIACIIVPILANGLRAFVTIAIGQRIGADAAGDVDHIVYGWVFFALVVAAILGVAWRWFERTPEEAGYTRDQIDALKWVESAQSLRAPPSIVTGAIAAMAAVAALFVG